MKRASLWGKRGVSAALTAAMLVAMTGCQGANTDVSTAGDGATESESGQDVETQENDTVKDTAYDFGGRTFRIGSYYDMTPDPSSNAVNAALSERIAYVEENYNCTIEFVDLGEDYVNDYVTSVLAGDPVCDIGYAITTTVLPTLIEGGIAYPISDLNVIDFDSYKWRADVIEAGSYKGKNYTLGITDPEIRYGIFWNKSLFEEYGLPDLYDLYDNGEWTWDKFKEVAQQGNIDKDNDGTIDIYGFNTRENLGWCYLYSNEAYVAEKTDAGMNINLGDSKVTEALTALQDFTTTVPYRDYNAGADDWDSLILSFQNGTSMMCLEEFWISYNYLGDMSDDWGWVPFPMGNSASNYSCYGKENGCRIILNGVEDPETVALVYDLITDVAETNEEWDNLLEDQLESWCDDAKTVENVTFIYSNGLSRINSVNGFATLNGAVNNLMNAVTSGEMTPQTALDTYQSEIDAAVADLEVHDYDADLEYYE